MHKLYETVGREALNAQAIRNSRKRIEEPGGCSNFVVIDAALLYNL